MTNPFGTIESATNGGVAGDFVVLPSPPAFIAPTATSKEHNTIKSALVPLACWRADDVRFDFDSSFIRPEISSEIAALKRLMDKHTLPGDGGAPTHTPVLTVFGHGDPTGNDDYNKVLSGRRAQALFAMLVRNVDLWEDLFAHPHGNDRWDPTAVQAMQTALGRPADKKPDGAQRRALFKDYMDSVCTVRDEDGDFIPDALGQPVALKLAPGDFLAGGSDPKGKGDFQGCGEFNPIRVFSKREQQEFQQPANKDARDLANAPNRRVIVFLFRPGARVRPEVWPCPRVKEGVADCHKRFWSDAEKRRAPQAERREFADTKDTFACRFYDRLSVNSPCERILEQFKVRLFSQSGRPLPGAPFLVLVGGRRIPGKANSDGDAILQHLAVPSSCHVFWSKPDADAPPTEPEDFDFERIVHVLPDEGDTVTGVADGDDASVKRLQNLGYTRHPDIAENIKDFQIDIGKSAEAITGRMADIRDELKRRHDSLNPPRRTPRSGR